MEEHRGHIGGVFLTTGFGCWIAAAGIVGSGHEHWGSPLVIGLLIAGVLGLFFAAATFGFLPRPRAEVAEPEIAEPSKIPLGVSEQEWLVSRMTGKPPK